MKKGMRILSLLLCICMLTASLSSCIFYAKVYDLTTDVMEGLINGDSNEPDEDVDEGPLKYTLTDEDREKFDTLLAECERLTLLGEDFDAIDVAWIELENQYYHIVTQSNIAYVLFSCNMEDEQLSEQTTYASEMQAEVFGEYMKVCQKIDQSNSPYREEFFSTWSEADMATMRLYTDEMTELSHENDQIVMDYYDLDPENTEDWEQICALYLDLIQNFDREATAMGYSDFYEYSNEAIYLRDATKHEREDFRAYVSEYLIPLMEQVSNAFFAKYDALSMKDGMLVESVMFTDYDKLSKDYVTEYINSYSGRMKSDLKSLLSSDRSIFTDEKNAEEGAYTIFFFDTQSPFCYFGPGYQDSFTVVHEMGHYYAGLNDPTNSVQLDLAETHSQGNEYLFLAFLEDELDEDVYEAIQLYQLYNSLCSIIIGTVIDEFEEYVYTHVDEFKSGTKSFDTVMYQICENYGGYDWFCEYITDIDSYWKYVVFDAPVYYVSYAYSAVAALSLYIEAIEDVENAREIYRALAEDMDVFADFSENLSKVGLPSPYEESVFVAICEQFS